MIMITRCWYCSPHYFQLDIVPLCMFECPTPRLAGYQPEESRAILTSHHASMQYQVSIQTTFVEPFDPVIGAQYLVLGEIEKSEGMSVLCFHCAFHLFTFNSWSNVMTQQPCLSQFCFQGTVKPLCVHGSLIVWMASMLHCYRRP